MPIINQPGASGGGSIAYPGTAAQVSIGNVALPADGGNHQVGPITGQAQSDWFDADGNITKAGLYVVQLGIETVDAATSTAVIASIGGPFYATVPFTVAAIDAASRAKILDVSSLADGDLPFPVSGFIQMPTDATWTAKGNITLAPLITP